MTDSKIVFTFIESFTRLFPKMLSNIRLAEETDERKKWYEIPEIFPIVSESQEEEIVNSPALTVFWREDTMPDNYRNRSQNRGDIRFRILLQKGPINNNEQQSYLYDVCELIRQAITGTYRQMLGILNCQQLFSREITAQNTKGSLVGREISFKLKLGPV